MKPTFNVKEFRFLSVFDNSNDKYAEWSRVYEYPWVLSKIDDIKFGKKTIHNTACGGHIKCHLDFIKDLEATEHDIINSDLQLCSPELEGKFCKFDIINDKMSDVQFDYVINISTVEHLGVEEQIKAINNLLEHVKVGGHLILTCDHPFANLENICHYLGTHPRRYDNELNGGNSVHKNENYSHLSIFVIDIIRIA